MSEDKKDDEVELVMQRRYQVKFNGGLVDVGAETLLELAQAGLFTRKEYREMMERLDTRTTEEKSAGRPLVYIAGPLLGSGNPYVNVANACRAGDTAYDLGWAPHVPHLNALWEMISGEDNGPERWLELDFAVLRRCDALLLLPGVSPGARREVALARTLGIPVFEGELPPAGGEGSLDPTGAFPVTDDKHDAVLDILLGIGVSVTGLAKPTNNPRASSVWRANCLCGKELNLQLSPEDLDALLASDCPACMVEHIHPGCICAAGGHK